MTERELVLVVEDDADMATLMELSLRAEGMEVIVAADGQKALAAAIEHSPDLVLLDIMLPNIDGFEVCQRLRSDARTRHTSIIMVTAKALSSDKVTGLASGADDYVTKPFDSDELIARVKSCLRRKREMQAVNPLTKLPGNVRIQQELISRVERDSSFALLHADLDNFKAFNDHYGFLRGDEAIKLLATCIVDAIRTHGDSEAFVGHVGGDDFVAITSARDAGIVADAIIDDWDRRVSDLYDAGDAARGYIEITDRKHRRHRVPMTSVSIGIATTAVRKITSHWRAAEIAVEMKMLAKRRPGSNYAIDRRKKE